MKFYIGLHIAAIAAIAAAGYCPPAHIPSHIEESRYAFQLKSFREQLDQCAEYLQIPQETVNSFVANKYITHDSHLKCLIRCVGINGGWWGVGGDHPGLHDPVIESYFRPACDDTCFVKRTQECLHSKVNKHHDDCSKAYESFLCYYHQYGRLKQSKEYIPLAKQDAIQAAVDCLQILRTPKELLKKYSHSEFPAVPETKCLYRCQYIAEGLYNGAALNLTRIYIRNHYLNAPLIKDPATQACVDSVLNEHAHNECARVYKARTCIDKYADRNLSSKIFQAAAVIALAQKTCDNEHSGPRYNPGPHKPKPCLK